MENHHDLRLTALAFLASAGSVPFTRYLKIGVIHVSHSSSTTANTSVALIDFSFGSPTNTYLLKCAKLIDAIFLNASAFLFSLLGTCLIENALKLLVNSIPSGLVSISPVLESSVQEDPSVNKIHGSGSSSASSIRVFGESSSGRSTMKSANIYPLTDNLASLSVIMTALTVSFAAARYTMSSSFSIGVTNMGSSAMSCFICLNASSASAVQQKSLFFVHFFNVLKNGNDFSADLAKNWFRLASFPFKFLHIL
ncbi:hypothetical protein Tco_1338145 [Tanacetum coccineum]